MLTLAISKGRICRETLPLLKRIGCAPDEAALDSRSLIVPIANPDVRIIVVRAKDAPTFVAPRRRRPSHPAAPNRPAQTRRQCPSHPTNGKQSAVA